MFVVSHVNSCLQQSKKWLLMRFILSGVVERTVRFLTTVDVVLGKYNNCMPNNKWFGVKHVSIVFGWTYVNGALLMINSTSSNTVCSSSNWFQKKRLQKEKGARPWRHPLNPPLFKNSYTSRYLFWSSLFAITVVFNLCFMKVFRKWSEEASISSKL